MSGEPPQQLTGSDAMWVRVEDWAGAQAVEEQVLAAVEHLLLPRINAAKDLQVGPPPLIMLKACTAQRIALIQLRSARASRGPVVESQMDSESLTEQPALRHCARHMVQMLFLPSSAPMVHLLL